MFSSDVPCPLSLSLSLRVLWSCCWTAVIPYTPTRPVPVCVCVCVCCVNNNSNRPTSLSLLRLLDNQRDKEEQEKKRKRTVLHFCLPLSVWGGFFWGARRTGGGGKVSEQVACVCMCVCARVCVCLFSTRIGLPRGGVRKHKSWHYVGVRGLKCYTYRRGNVCQWCM